MVYEYRARVERVIDGDTLVCTLDLGYGIHRTTQHIRLLDIDTAELRGPERETGLLHRAWVVAWIEYARREQSDGDTASWPFVFDSQEWQMDGFRRALGFIRRADTGAELTASLHDEFGDAVAYER